MSDWVERLHFTQRLIIAVVLLAAVGLGMVGIGYVNRKLANTETKAVLPLEITPSKATARHIVDDWSKHDDALDAARTSTYMDFPFIIVYSATFWFFCVWAGVALSPRNERWLARGRAFGRAGVIAGALDFFVENAGLLLEMNGTYSSVITAIKALGAWIKWLLVFCVAAYLLVSLMIWLWTASKQSLAHQLLRQ